jgi:hypothetical protein
VAQCLSSTVFPVSVSFDVEGQRTSKLLMFGPGLVFGRRGGSKKNLTGLESVDDARFRGVVRRHLEFDAVANRQPNETLTHPSGNVCEHEVLIRQRNTKHCPGQYSHNRSLDLDGFFGIHDVDLTANSSALTK